MQIKILVSSISLRTLHSSTCWDGRDRFLSESKPDSPLHMLYRELLTVLQDPAHRARATFVELFEKLGVPDPVAYAHNFFTAPPALILAPYADYGCHTRATHLLNYIFVSSNVWAYVETQDNPLSPIAMHAYEVTKATIVHELGRCAVWSVSHLTTNGV